MSRKERLFPDRYTSQPSSIAEVLGGKELTPEEIRASQAADVMNISFKDKRILFGASIFIKQGFFRVRELLGTTADQSVDMRDRVVTNPEYQQRWRQFNILQKPHFLEVARGKKQKKKHREIALELDMPKLEVDAISKYLIAAGIIQASPLGRANAAKFRALVDEVERIDVTKTEDGFRQSEAELAGRFIVSIDTIRRARLRRRIEAQEAPVSPRLSKKPNYEKVKARRAKVLEGLNRGLTNQQISEEYSFSIVNVRDDRRWWRDQKVVATVTGSREANMELMRKIMQDHLESNPQGAILNLKAVQRSGLIPVSYTEIWNLYNIAAAERIAAGLDVPHLKKLPKRKKPQ